MATQSGIPTWNIGQPEEKPQLTKAIIAEKGRMVSEKYQHVLVALTSAAMELGANRDPLGLRLLTQAVELALESGVALCAAGLGADLDEDE